MDENDAPDKPRSYWNDASIGLRSVELRAAGFDPERLVRSLVIRSARNPRRSVNVRSVEAVMSELEDERKAAERATERIREREQGAYNRLAGGAY